VGRRILTAQSARNIKRMGRDYTRGVGSRDGQEFGRQGFGDRGAETIEYNYRSSNNQR
jgi:hypothetical protein